MGPIDGLQAAAQIPKKRPDQAQTILAIGKREMGKTTLLRSYAARTEPRRIAVDPFGDFVGGYETFTDYREGLEAMLHNKRSYSIRLEPPRHARLVDWGRQVFGALLSVDAKRTQWDALFLLDEIHRYARTVENDEILELGLQARHYGLRLALGSQRMVNVPTGMMSEVTDLACFQIRSPADRKRLAEWTDEEWEAENAYRLEQGECFLYSPL